jgi:hypothetical protein
MYEALTLAHYPSSLLTKGLLLPSSLSLPALQLDK